MKKTFLFLFALSICLAHSLYAQDKAQADKLVDEGVPYHDKGDYEGAIKRYDQALAVDKDNLLALSEKALTLYTMGKYDDVIPLCKRAIKKHPNDSLLANVYVTYGDALDAMKHTDESLAIFDEGIQKFNYYYQLYFNKAITLTSVKQYDDAIDNFQKALKLNPDHPGSCNTLARILDYQGKRIPAILIYARFLISEPQSERAHQNFDNLMSLMKSGAEQTSENNITITTGGTKSSKGKPFPDDFATATLALSLHNAADLNKDSLANKPLKQFENSFKKLCNILAETKGNNFGFYWDFMAPYFIELNRKNFTETFSYIVFASQSNPADDVKDWLKDHKDAIQSFYDWDDNYQWSK
jgi:Tfp pilus assembly protein PilF